MNPGLPAGTRLGPYEIKRALGAGGMGEVYEARDTRLDRTVAIKILPSADPDLKARFEREARSIAALAHPHICTLYDIGHEAGLDFLVMEYLEGDTLAQRLAGGALPFDDALTIAIEIGGALSAAHAHGIVHRDLKPGNVMLSAGGAKLLDFGLATGPRRLPPLASTAGTMSEAAALTKDGVILGTVGYMAPEQAAGKLAGPPSDVFSFGVIFYEMLTGRRAFARRTAVETLAAIIRDPIEPLPAAAAPVRTLIERSLEKDPARRFASMHELTAELVELRESRPRSPSRAAATPLVERRVITALAIEIVRPSSLSVPISPERLKRALDGALLELNAAIDAEGGIVERSAGDTIHALFGAPVARADDPQRALRAARVCIERVEAGGQTQIPLTVRVGVETGDAIVDVTSASEARHASVGTCLTLATRLQQLARPAQVLVGPTCRDANAESAEFVELGQVELVGVGRLPVSRLVAAGTRPTRARLPLVGREAELDLLRLVYRRTRSHCSALALVSGPPGQGKSRLVQELIAEIGDEAQVLHAACRPAGELGVRIPLLALLMSRDADVSLERLADLLQSIFPEPLERQRVLTALGHSAGLRASPELTALPTGQSQDEIANGWRRFLAALAREKPIVMWVDDLHWADTEFVRLLDRLTFVSEMPLLVVATARPEFQPEGAFRAGGNRFFITLDTLAEADARRLAELAGGASAPRIERAQGNPLFIIELARAQALDSSEVPVTLQGAIGARLDELSPRDRELLQRAAVVGETFTVRDASLLSERDAADVSRAVDRLTDLLYLHPVPGGLRFHHGLVRDVAYGRLTAGERMHLHARYARDGVPAGAAAALAHHLWEAVGPDDADWVWEDGKELRELRARALTAHLLAARDYGAVFAYERAIEACRRAFRFAAEPLDVAAVEGALARVCAASGDADEAATHYLRVRDVYRGTGGLPPADWYADFLEHPIYTSGMFRSLPDESVVIELLEEGERVARQTGDTMSLARILALGAYRSHDASQLVEALRLSERVSDPAPFGSFLGHAAILQHRVGAFALAKRIYERLDTVAGPVGATDDDRRLEFRAILALHTGELDEAGRFADRFLTVSASRGPHLRTHAFREQSHVLLARGDWPALRDLGERTERLVAEHRDTAFCYAVTTVRAFTLVALAVEHDLADSSAMLTRVEAPLQAEPFERESLLALVYGALGKGDALNELVNRIDTLDARPMWFFQRACAVALTMLERWKQLDDVLPSLERVAGNGSPYLAALLAAMREEMYAARGGAAPVHAQLRQLGYFGWSRLLRHRPS